MVLFNNDIIKTTRINIKLNNLMLVTLSLSIYININVFTIIHSFV